MLDRVAGNGTVPGVPMRKILTSLAAGAVVLLLAGCETRITTRVDVRSDATAVVQASVRFTGAIADQLDADAALRRQFETQLEARGLAFESSRSGNEYVAVLRGEEIAASGSLTGVAGVRIEQRADGSAAVLVATQRPMQLEAALVESVRNEPDRDALAVTAAENTLLRIEIVYPGAVRSTDSGTVEGNTVSYEEQLADWPVGVLSTVGSLDEGGASLRWWYTGAALVLTAGIWIAARARRQ